MEKEIYAARAKIIKAIAHPTRLFILDELKKNERCVNELTDLIGADISTVSKHLSVLKQSGLVSNEKRGLCIYYSLKYPQIYKMIDCVEEILRHNIEEQQKFLN